MNIPRPSRTWEPGGLVDIHREADWDRYVERQGIICVQDSELFAYLLEDIGVIADDDMSWEWLELMGGIEADYPFMLPVFD